MAHPAIPWHLTAEYVALTSGHIPGTEVILMVLSRIIVHIEEANSLIVGPYLMGANPTDVTSFVYK